MNTPILNRDFQHPADGWYNIEAKGIHPNARARLVQVIDDPACQSIVNRFNADAAKPGFAGLLIDHEHFKHDDDKETRAYGWLEKLENRADGIYGQIRWTDTGKKAVDGGDYRFFSTEYDPADLVVLNKGQKPKQVRPMKLDGLTLTNVNNNKGQKPITNRNMNTENDPLNSLAGAIFNSCRASGAAMSAAESLEAADKILNGDYPGHPFHGNQFVEGSSGRSQSNRASGAAHDATRDAMKSGDKADHEHASAMHKHAAAAANKSGNKSLALYHDSMANMHADAAKGKISAKNRGEASESTTMSTRTKLGLAPDASEEAVEAEVTKIKNRNTELETSVVEADLETYKNRFDPKQKEFIKSLLVTNREKTVEFLKGQPETKAAASPARVHNRASAEPADKSVTGEAESDSATQIAEGIRVIRVTNREITYAQAREQLRREQPELFGLPKRGGKK
jgi:hypothetical protein